MSLKSLISLLILFFLPYSLAHAKTNSERSIIRVDDFQELILVVTPSNQDVGTDAGTVDFGITANTTWEVTDNADWLTISLTSGSGDGSITATYEANLLPEPRIGTITVSGAGVTSVIVTVTQRPYYTLSVSPLDLWAFECGSEHDIRIESNTNWTAVVDGNVDWVYLNPMSGSGNGTISVRIDYNGSGGDRYANILIVLPDGFIQAINVYQPTSEFFVNPNNVNVGPEAGTTTFSILPMGGTIVSQEYEVFENLEWLTVSPTSYELDISVTYAANPLMTAREGRIEIFRYCSGATFSITQEGAPAFLDISSSTLQVDYQEGTNNTLSITSNTDWAITDDADWLTIEPLSGSGNGTITVVFEANSMPEARIGTITISGTGVTSQTVAVTQSPYYTLSVEPPTIMLDACYYNAQQISIKSNTSWTVSLDPNAWWLTVSPMSGTGDGVIAVSAYDNAEPSERQAILTITLPDGYAQTITILQSGGTVVTVEPNNRDVEAEAGSTTFNVFTWSYGWVDYGFMVYESVDWITVEPMNGWGFTEVTVNYSANKLSPKRSGEICFFPPCSGVGMCATLNQEGAPAYLDVSPSTLSVDYLEGSSATFEISSNTNWTAQSSESWLMISNTAGFGNATITVTAQKNPTISPRNAIVTLKVAGLDDKIVTVNQDGATDIQEGVTKHGQNTTTGTDFVSRNGKITDTPALTRYGQALIFSNCSTVADIDGNCYNIVTIGSYIWMAENLRTTKFRDGSDIQLGAADSVWSSVWKSFTDDDDTELRTPLYCWYNNDSTNKYTYGALYNAFAAINVCPVGWRLPDTQDFYNTMKYLNPDSSFCITLPQGKLKATGTIEGGDGLWHSPNDDATNETGFTGLPGGRREVSGSFMQLGYYGNWWLYGHKFDVYDCLAYFPMNNQNQGLDLICPDPVLIDNLPVGYSVRCIKDTPTAITTTEMTFITQTSAKSGGNIVNDDGGATVNARGVCWNTSPNPTVDLGTKTSDGTGIGSFVSTITGLTPGTIYYLRAYATNSAGTAYGDEITFETYNADAITDIDGNYYNIVTIGNQVWMAENLKTTKYNDGTSIPYVTDDIAWSNQTTPGYCWFNNDEAANKAIHGAYYNWYTVDYMTNGNKNVCPDGWHVPIVAEWSIMIDYLIANGYNYDGTITGNKIAKSLGSLTSWWLSDDVGAIGNIDYPEYRNRTGFTAFSSGNRYPDGRFNVYPIGCGVWWWTPEKDISPGSAIDMEIRHNSVNIYEWRNGVNFGFNIRCVKD